MLYVCNVQRACDLVYVRCIRSQMLKSRSNSERSLFLRHAACDSQCCPENTLELTIGAQAALPATRLPESWKHVLHECVSTGMSNSQALLHKSRMAQAPFYASAPHYT